MININNFINKVSHFFCRLFLRLNYNEKVNFIICGTQKGGTTALDAYLREHPEVCMANQKEVHFFDTEDFFSNVKPDYSKYHNFFRPKLNHKICGEATPIYMYWRCAIKRIYDYNPRIKIILILRDPIERAFSHWNMERSKGADYFSFSDAIYSEKERCALVYPFQHRVYSYVDRGHYLKQIKEIWSYFPKDNVLILKSDSLKNNPALTLGQVSNFLNIKEFPDISPKIIHSRTYQSSMTAAEHKYLKGIYYDEIMQLEKELGWDCSDWLITKLSKCSVEETGFNVPPVSVARNFGVQTESEDTGHE